MDMPRNCCDDCEIAIKQSALDLILAALIDADDVADMPEPVLNGLRLARVAIYQAKEHKQVSRRGIYDYGA